MFIKDHRVRFALFHPDFIGSNSDHYTIEIKDNYGNILEGEFSFSENLPVMVISVIVDIGGFDYLLLNLKHGEHLLDICPLEVRFKDISYSSTVDTPCFLRKQQLKYDSAGETTLPAVVCIVDFLPKISKNIKNTDFEYVVDVKLKVNSELNRGSSYSTIESINEHMIVSTPDDEKLESGMCSSFQVDIRDCDLYNLLFKIHSNFHTSLTVTEISNTCIKIDIASNDCRQLFIEIGANDQFMPSKSILFPFEKTNVSIINSPLSVFDVENNQISLSDCYEKLTLTRSNEEKDEFCVDTCENSSKIWGPRLKVTEQNPSSKIVFPVDGLCVLQNEDTYQKTVNNQYLRLDVPNFISSITNKFHWVHICFGSFLSKLSLKRGVEHFFVDAQTSEDLTLYKISQLTS